ncbi:MAG: hypothetical protein J0H19_02405 [Rhodospirillales bacterium]|nr:hypothetical protein [Rhodospirillales bacterium]
MADRSGQGAPLLRYATAPASAPCRPVARVAGLLGGIGAMVSTPRTWSPALDPDIGWQTDAVQLGAGTGWTCLLVWSRPNWKQGIAPDTADSVLLSVTDRPILSVQGRGGSGELVLFPGSTHAVLGQTLSRRHTHSVLLRHTPERGVDAWLDGRPVGAALPCSLAPAEAPPLLLLHAGTPHGAAQCWLHEAAVWSRSLSDGEASAVGTYVQRWPTGPRKGVSILVNGQSNAINYALNDGAALLLAKGLAWHLGAIAYNAVARIGATGYTMAAGHGLYAALGSYPGDFLHDPGDGSPPSGWGLGADGQALGQVLAALPPEDLADIRAILWPWNETDSLRAYGEKATFSAAAMRFLGLLRGMLGDTGGAVPLVWWNAIPYGSTDGIQMHREVAGALAAMPLANVVIGNPQTSDSNPRGATWDPHDGIFTGGDPAHRDSTDNQRFARLAAPVVARRLLASGFHDSLDTIPASLPNRGGPRIVHVYRQSADTLLLTIAHDAGTDLRVPLQAQVGLGFAVMDGGSIAAPGPIRHGIACNRIDATHLLLRLDGALNSPSDRCRLYYPYGAMPIGRGNCITDDFASVAKPPGWDIAEGLGTSWREDFPLAATDVGIVLSDLPD